LERTLSFAIILENQRDARAFMQFIVFYFAAVFLPVLARDLAFRATAGRFCGFLAVFWVLAEAAGRPCIYAFQFRSGGRPCDYAFWFVLRIGHAKN
jgi:hypothetical protein